MSKDDLLTLLTRIHIDYSDDHPEIAHRKADEALLEYIDDPEIAEIYDMIHKWYE